MKTIKFIFSLLVSLVLVLPAMAQNETEDAVYIYAEDISAVLGDEVELPIAMTNTMPIHSFEFNITIPEGVSFVSKGASYKYTLVEEGLEGWTITVERFNSSQTAKIMGYYVSATDLSLQANEETTLFTLTLSVSDDAVLDDAKIVLSNEVFATSQNGGSGITPDIPEDDLSSNIEAVTYVEGYSLKLSPVFLAEDTDIPIILTCASTITSIEFDLLIDKAFVEKEYWYTSISSSDYPTKNYNIVETSLALGKHFSIVRRKTNVISEAGSKTIVTLGLENSDEGNSPISDGVYVVTVKNIKLINSDNQSIAVAPYSADIYVGSSAKATVNNGVVAYHGDYTDASLYNLLVNSVPTDNNTITTLDLTSVTAVPNGTNQEFTLSNPNALIRTTNKFNVQNQNNVVVGKACSKLVLTDGYAFANTKKFTATEASYSRDMTSHKWGTLCLPFAASATNANLYSLETVSTDPKNGEMTFKQEATNTASANKPYVIKKTSNSVSFNASSIDVPVTPDLSVVTVIDHWSMKGTTTGVNFSLTEEEATKRHIYFINNNQFWKVGGELYVAPFRAYFEYENEDAQAPANFRISEDTEGIEEIQTEADNATIYDLQGRTIQTPVAGQIYIRGAKKYIVK